MLNMADKWTKYKLSELGFLGRGKSKHRPRNDISLFGGSYPFIQTGEIKAANLYISNYEQTYNEKGLAQSKLWNEGTLCMTIAANIAETAILKIKACFPDSIVGFVADNKLCNVYFIKYYIDFIKNKMQSVSGGACQDNLSLDKIAYFDVEAPKKKIQDKIAKILSNYDDLIENNNKRIKILEEIAQKIYKEWFVDFKFPNYETATFKDSELGKIPTDWEIVTVNTFCNIFTGKKNANMAIPNGKYQFYTCAPDPLLIDTYIHDGRAVIIAGNGSYTGRTLFYNGKFDLYQRTYACTIKENHTDDYIYTLYAIIKNSLEKDISGGTHGAAIPYIVFEDIAKHKFAFNKTVFDKSSIIFKKIFDAILLFNKKNQTLKQTRDILLPRLISGEIDVENLNIL